MPAYDLINVKKYLDYTEGWSYEIARGCPHRCRFCYVHYFHDRKWRSKSVKKAVSEIKYIAKRYKIKNLKFVGDNFFVNKKLVLDVCKGITPLKLEWSSYIRIDYLDKYTDEDMKILKNSGCWLLLMGAESGSQEMLDYMQKDITPKQTVKAAKKCVKFGIIPLLFMMVGLPKENRRHIIQTIDFYDNLRKIKGVEIDWLGIYWPYAGTPMHDDAIKAGFEAPKSISEWADAEINKSRLPWHKKIDLELNTIAALSRFRHIIDHIKHFSKKSVERKVGILYPIIVLGLIPFKLSYAIRWKLRLFKFGYEWHLFQLIQRKLTQTCG